MLDENEELKWDDMEADIFEAFLESRSRDQKKRNEDWPQEVGDPETIGTV